MSEQWPHQQGLGGLVAHVAGNDGCVVRASLRLPSLSVTQHAVNPSTTPQHAERRKRESSNNGAIITGVSGWLGQAGKAC